jgi:hypothetical protein
MANFSLLPLALLPAIAPDAHFAVLTLLSIFIADRFILLQARLTSNISQAVAIGMLALFVVTAYLFLDLLSSQHSVYRTLVSAFFIFSVPAALAAAVLGQWIIGRLCRATEQQSSQADAATSGSTAA